MWLKALEFLLSAGSYIYGAWQRMRQKQAIETEIKAKQEKLDEKAIQSAEAVRAGITDNPDLLLSPKDRASHNID